MKHTSIKLETPCEFINITPLNPLISKCQIKVCYVGDEANRNRSVITKDVAKQIANSLPGSPIVGFYNDGNGDFEEHNRVIDISNGKFEIKDTTRPYGFVDLGAKVWFQKFADDGIEHEYLMTEGYLWTGQYPEAQRIIDQGNNQSMELDEKTISAHWVKDKNGKPQFFIINEAVISKLCILGEECEPCFEGSTIEEDIMGKVQFSFEDDFKNQLFSMMNQLKELLDKGGAQVFTKYAVEIGDALWSALYSYVEKTYPDGDNCYCSIYRIEGVYEEGAQKFAILQNRKDMKYYRLNFAITETSGLTADTGLTEVTKNYTPAIEPQFALADVEEFESNYAKQKQEEADKKDPPADPPKDEETCPECGKPLSECTCEKKKKYNLEEVTEYTELQTKFSELEGKYNQLLADKQALDAQVTPLIEFKAQAEKAEKEAMINSFYMLSDEDKKDVIDNINTYSLNDIEAKLSILCVRNKVSFNLDDDKSGAKGPTSYNLNGGDLSGATTPAWIKALDNVAKNMK